MSRMGWPRPGHASRRVVWLGMLVGAAACGPRIHRFSVTPLRICQGDSVFVTYAVRGTPSLVVTRWGTPADTTRYTLRATKGTTVRSAAQDVVTYPPGHAKGLSFDADVNPAGDSIIARATLGMPTWPADLLLEEIRADFDRPLRISHAGRDATLPAGPQQSGVWAGLSVAGEWFLGAALLNGEGPGPGMRRPPTFVDVTAVICR